MSYDEIYALAISQGATSLFADMLASRCPPGSMNTDRAYMEDRMHNNGIPDTMPKNLQRKLLAAAKRAGVSISGKQYCSGLARYPNDPYGWVSSRDEVLAKTKENGWIAEGNVNYKPAEAPLTPRERRQEKQHARA